jgi:hypothetical protein
MDDMPVSRKRAMKRLLACLGLLLVTAPSAFGQSRLACTPVDSANTTASIWPTPYLQNDGSLCFDVTGWRDYAGRNCVRDGGSIAWSGLVIVHVDGESQGRDSTEFRVVKPIVRPERIAYRIEWRREGDWRPMRDISINRLSGEAVSRSLTGHGSDTFQCRLEQRKL